MTKSFLFLGSVFCGSAVALGAFAAHALREKLEPRMLEVFQTGVQYQFLHGLALLALAALAQGAGDPAARFRLSGALFSAGILLFSGSLYALALTGIRPLGAITPIGGVLFLLGWASLAWTAWKS